MIVDCRLQRPEIFTVQIRVLRACLWIFTVGGILVSGPAPAEYNSLVPTAQFGVRYDDNPRFQLDGTETDSAQGLLLDFSLPYSHARETWSTSLRPRYVRSFYRQEENSDLEDEDFYLLGNSNRRFTRSNISANYGYTNLSLRTSEFEDPDNPLPGEPPSGNVIIRDFKDSQVNFFFVPSWQYQLSMIDVVGLNAGFRKTEYDISRPTNLFDSDSKNVGTFYRRLVSQRHTVGLSANLSNYSSENDELQVKNESTSNSVSLIYVYTWSDTATLSTNLGWARTNIDISRPNFFLPFPPFSLCDPTQAFCSSKSKSDNFVGNISLDIERETSGYQLQIGQQITPNSNGAQTLLFNISGSANRKFSDRLSGRASILLLSQSNVGDSQFDFDRDYIRPTVTLNYKLSRKWSLYARYNYTWSRQQTTEISSETTNRDQFFSAGFRFSGDGWKW